MAILERVDPLKDIKDWRGTGRTFFVATCNQCGRTFWPNRSTAKYCSKNCNDRFNKSFNALYNFGETVDPDLVMITYKKPVSTTKPKMKATPNLTEEGKKARLKEILKRVEKSRKEQDKKNQK